MPFFWIPCNRLCCTTEFLERSRSNVRSTNKCFRTRTTKSSKNESMIRWSPERFSCTKDCNTSLTTNRVTSGNNILNKECCCCTFNIEETVWTYLRSSIKNMSIINPRTCSTSNRTVIFRRCRYCKLIWNCLLYTSPSPRD